MPLYEFKCEHCDKHFEVIRRWTQRDEVRCPTCDRPVKKQITSFAIGGGSSAKTSSKTTTTSGCGWGGG